SPTRRSAATSCARSPSSSTPATGAAGWGVVARRLSRSDRGGGAPRGPEGPSPGSVRPLGGRGVQFAVEPLSFLLEPLPDQAQPGDLAAGPDPDVVGVLVAGQSQCLGDGDAVGAGAVVPDQGPIGAAPGADVFLERQPVAVTQQEGLRLPAPYL